MNILFPERLKELMEEQGLNQVELAKRVGIKQNTISAWLSTKKLPNIVSLWAIADFFNVEVDFLIGRKDY